MLDTSPPRSGAKKPLSDGLFNGDRELDGDGRIHGIGVIVEGCAHLERTARLEGEIVRRRGSFPPFRMHFELTTEKYRGGLMP